jgi:hypothetical protein
MPLYLNELDVVPELARFQSVLIVPCRFCPAASLAMKENKPYIELFRRFLRTASYERYIRSLQARLAEEGVKTSVFETRLPHQFFLCMWTSARREELARRARQHDAVLVLGCDSATETVRDACRASGRPVFQGMEVEGLVNFKPKLHFPCNVRLELSSVSRTLHRKNG